MDPSLLNLTGAAFRTSGGIWAMGPTTRISRFGSLGGSKVKRTPKAGYPIFWEEMASRFKAAARVFMLFSARKMTVSRASGQRVKGKPSWKKSSVRGRSAQLVMGGVRKVE